MTGRPTDAVYSLRRNIAVGGVAGLLFAGLAGTLAFGIDLSGAVVAGGMLVVDGNVKKIQHPTGGIVGELLARNGDAVKAGQVLVRLDDTQTRANLAIVAGQIDELAAKRAREEAERDGLDRVVFPEDMLARAADPVVAKLIAGEIRLFASRKEARENQKSQLREQIAGLDVQRDSRVSQIEWIAKELEGVRHLWEQKLVPYTKLTSLEREAARLDGERGQLISSIAETKVKIAQIDQDLRAETGKDLADIRAKMAELAERKVAAEDQLRRIELKSPLDGVVHQSEVHTVGGVVSPGETIMLVVPHDDALTAEIKVPPQEIDQVHVGQAAWLKFTAFNQRTTPEIDGEVKLVSADVTQDPKSGATYYTARIAVPAEQMKKLEGQKLIAGMPVEAFVRTADRSIMSYLTRPMTDQIARAFREK